MHHVPVRHVLYSNLQKANATNEKARHQLREFTLCRIEPASISHVASLAPRRVLVQVLRRTVTRPCSFGAFAMKSCSSSRSSNSEACLISIFGRSLDDLPDSVLCNILSRTRVACTGCAFPPACARLQLLPLINTRIDFVWRGSATRWSRIKRVAPFAYATSHVHASCGMLSTTGILPCHHAAAFERVLSKRKT